MMIAQRLWPRRSFRIPPFEVAPLEFESVEDVDEPLLEELVSAREAVPVASPKLRLVPTAGELRDRIEDHLRANQGGARRVDAANELRAALAELRRSLR